jgi:hypothetical protein
LGRSRQENEGGKALAEVFKLMGTLEEVVMPQNGIYHVGIEALADAWGNNPNLRILNINDNTLTEKGAKHLAVALKTLKHLEVLNIGDCLLKTSGALLIAEALKESGAVKLQELYMDSNEIRIEGGLAIVEAVKSSPNLKILMLDGNQFGDDGCSKIEQILKDSGKSHIMEEFEDDQGSDEDSDEDDDDSNEEGDDDYEDEEDEDGGDEDNDGKSVENVSSGLFGSKQGTPSLFGTATTANTSSTSIFGETKACSIFGTPSQETKAYLPYLEGISHWGQTTKTLHPYLEHPKIMNHLLLYLEVTRNLRLQYLEVQHRDQLRFLAKRWPIVLLEQILLYLVKALQGLKQMFLVVHQVRVRQFLVKPSQVVYPVQRAQFSGEMHPVR